MSKIVPILVLILLSPVLAELVSGTLPLPLFFNPGTFIFLGLIGYGLPALVIRELSVRYRLGMQGLFLVGLGYGFFNEGLLAKTMIMREQLPIEAFDNYGYALGVSWLWAVVIAMWQALAAVFFPILFVHWIFPGRSQEPWLDRFTPWILALVLVSFASTSFLAPSHAGIQGFGQQLVLLLVMMGLFFTGAVASKKPKSVVAASHNVRITPLFLGLSILPVLLLTSIVANIRPHPSVFLIYFGTVVWLYIRVLRTRGWLMMPNLLLFGVGCYMQSVLMGMVIRVLIQKVFIVEVLITGIVAEIILIIFASHLKRIPSQES